MVLCLFDISNRQYTLHYSEMIMDTRSAFFLMPLFLTDSIYDFYPQSILSILETSRHVFFYFVPATNEWSMRVLWVETQQLS